jgi:hypothetical protein
MNTPDNHNLSTAFARCVLFATLSTLTACGPDIADGFGSDIDSTDAVVDGGTSEDPVEPGTDIRCVELVPGQVSCWTDWDLAWARVMLPCQVTAGVEGLAWTEGYDVDVAGWGPVVCHDVLAGGRFCLYGEANVLLSQSTEGWVPEVSALVGQLPAVDPPCGDYAPGTLGSNCDPALANIECVDANLCWAYLPAWSARGQYAEPEALQAAVDAQVYIPADIGLNAKCFNVKGTDAHVCAVDVDCVGLLGRPSDELELVPSNCAGLGPWQSIWQTNTQCFGVVEGVAVLLDPL